MIAAGRRLADRMVAAFARRLVDRGWLRSMRYREVEALRSVHHAERRERRQSWPERTVYPDRGER